VSYDNIVSEYDAAFAWETDPGVILPVWEQLGRPSRVIEFACGPARLLSTLVANGCFGVGMDVSEPMLALARKHLDASGGKYELHQGRLETFEITEVFGGAFCAAGSFGHLTTREAAHAHLVRARRSLTEDGRYAIQLSLKPLLRTAAQVPDGSRGWEFGLDGETLRYTWYGTGIDPVAKQELQRSRIEWLTGPRRGEITENDHLMAIWDWHSWSEAVDRAGFRQIAALDTPSQFRALEIGPSLEQHPQCWHVLAVR